MEDVKYMSAQEISDKWEISKRRVQVLCANGRIAGAIRIGNMWAIPSGAPKPSDARIQEAEDKKYYPEKQARNARKELKSIVEEAMSDFRKKGQTPEEALHTIVVCFASHLLHKYIKNMDYCLKACEMFFNHRIEFELSAIIKQKIISYIAKNDMNLDDTLSWVYQFGSKKDNSFKYKDTQFFTEKYMVTYLVDALELDMTSSVIDPACGGGNFLLYAFEILAKDIEKRNVLEGIEMALEQIKGYEIDRFLAFVAAFNLKYKAMSLLGPYCNIDIELFYRLHTRIYYPKEESISGFLDQRWDNQIVLNCCGTGETTLKKLFEGVNVVATNPPFQTVKGMSLDLKSVLRADYPESKCDMCAAFIERILFVLDEGGKAAMVTQNSWMYLDSFYPLRKRILEQHSIDTVLELGSNAFYDLSGEKANVALVLFSKNKPNKSHAIKMFNYRNMSTEKIENLVKDESLEGTAIKQQEVLGNAGARFDMFSTAHLKELQKSCTKYNEYAVPMQGTSTGDAKRLIDYYWKHIDDEEWIHVSKGGGYSRYEGLNSYCVKWGEEGEYIKATKGSAIRNAKYFDKTQLVFSDTGTSGLNVRVLLPGQIFVASGPGIRIAAGKEMAHLAFLNSRFAAFYVRLTSPKLTIAARYIGQIPVNKSILESPEMENRASECVKSKKNRLSKRASNLEFTYFRHESSKSIREMAKSWFCEDLSNEWSQLLSESKIDEIVFREMKLSNEDISAIDRYLGRRLICSNKEEDIEINENEIKNILNVECFPKKTIAKKGSLGTDGIVEYISQLYGVSCEAVKEYLHSHFEWFENYYIDLYMHGLVMSALQFKSLKINKSTLSKTISDMGLKLKSDLEFAEEWITHSFNRVHSDVFVGNPLYMYKADGCMLVRV